MARHKSRVRHTRRRRSRTRSRKQAGGILPLESETQKTAEPAADVVAEKQSIFSGFANWKNWFNPKPPAAPEEEQKGGRRKKSRKHHHRRHRK